MRRHKIMIVEDEKLLGKSIQRFLSHYHDCTLFTDAESAQASLETDEVDMVVSDIRLPGKSGMELLQWIREKKMEMPVIMITAHSSIRNAVEAIRHGASDYITKPLDLTELEFAIRKALETQELREEIHYHRQKQQTMPNDNYLTGSSMSSQEIESVMQRLIQVEEQTGETPSLLITGPTGTGKSALARRLHQQSPRAEGPFIELNCTAVTESMFESELFGHEKGAFTGAAGKRIGLFELAHGGTLFLDEVGHAPLSIQAKLLLAIENKKIRRVGGNQEITVNVRLIAATNLDLQTAFQEGHFREDLYHRLALIHLRIPALSERLEDIRPLAQFFLQKAKTKYKCEGAFLSDRNLEELEQYSWPGNIRELSNEIERSVLLYNGRELRFDYLFQLTEGLPTAKAKAQGGTSISDSRSDAAASAKSSSINPSPELVNETPFLQLPPEGLDLATLETRILEQAVLQTNHNVAEAAKLLHVSRETLRYYLEKYAIDQDHLTGWPQSIPREGIPFDQVEKIVIEQALQRTKGNVTGAARLLNSNRDILRYRIEKYRLSE